MSMTEVNNQEKIAIFTDLYNIHNAARKKKTNLATLIGLTADGREIVSHHIYNKMAIDSQEKADSWMNQNDEKTKDTWTIDSHTTVPDFRQDSKMISEAMAIVKTSSYDTIAIVGGIGDFTPLIKLVKTFGMKIEFMTFSEYSCISVMDGADKITNIDYLPIYREEYDETIQP